MDRSTRVHDAAHLRSLRLRTRSNPNGPRRGLIVSTKRITEDFVLVVAGQERLVCDDEKHAWQRYRVAMAKHRESRPRLYRLSSRGVVCEWDNISNWINVLATNPIQGTLDGWWVPPE